MAAHRKLDQRRDDFRAGGLRRGVASRCSYHFGVALWRAIRQNSRMNPRNTIIAILATLSAASLALADDFKTIDGKEYKDATVTRVEPDGIVVRMKSGIVKLYFSELPKEVQERLDH